MNFSLILHQTRHVRSPFPYEDRYYFSPEAEVIISEFCDIYSMPREKIVFYPAYTSRASPEIVKIQSESYIVWDYHYFELLNSLNIVAVTNYGRKNDPYLRDHVGESSVQQHFICCLFRYLSCQFFRKPFFSEVLGEAASQYANRFSPPISRSNESIFRAITRSQWRYILNHELAHIYFSGAGEINQDLSYIYFRAVIDKALAHVDENDGEMKKMIVLFLRRMQSEFDKTIAEELVCDDIAYKRAVSNYCNSIEPDSIEAKIEAIKYTGAAIGMVNEYKLLLKFLRLFWREIIEIYYKGINITEETVSEALRHASLRMDQEVLRGTIGFDISLLAIKESLIARDETEKIENDRPIDKFHSGFIDGWKTLRGYADTCVSYGTVKLVLSMVTRNKSRKTPGDALASAQQLAGW